MSEREAQVEMTGPSGEKVKEDYGRMGSGQENCEEKLQDLPP